MVLSMKVRLIIIYFSYFILRITIIETGIFTSLLLVSTKHGRFFLLLFSFCVGELRKIGKAFWWGIWLGS
jgi:hypothetical protein